MVLPPFSSLIKSEGVSGVPDASHVPGKGSASGSSPLSRRDDLVGDFLAGGDLALLTIPAHDRTGPVLISVGLGGVPGSTGAIF